MDYSKKSSTTSGNNSSVDEYQAIRVHQLENKFNFKFNGWLHGLAMTIHNPVKIYSWMIGSKKYSVTWDAEQKIISIDDNPNEKKKYHWAHFGYNGIKSYLDKELSDYFGNILFKVNGEMMK